MTALRRLCSAVLLPVALFAFAASASPRDVRLQGPDGDGGACPEMAAEAETPSPRAPKRANAPREKAKPATVRGGGSAADGGARPRWHSFLPGMFR
jgi:hypothetical protein